MYSKNIIVISPHGRQAEWCSHLLSSPHLQGINVTPRRLTWFKILYLRTLFFQDSSSPPISQIYVGSAEKTHISVIGHCHSKPSTCWIAKIQCVLMMRMFFLSSIMNGRVKKRRESISKCSIGTMEALGELFKGSTQRKCK